jgi:hypothetical protein
LRGAARGEHRQDPDTHADRLVHHGMISQPPRIARDSRGNSGQVRSGGPASAGASTPVRIDR